jgi:para-nitrobenzyl esterase
LSWGPSADGDVLPYQLFSNEAFELSKNIPLMIGTTINEFTVFRGGMPSNSTEEQAKEAIKKVYADKTDAYIAAVKKAYPNGKMTDMLSYDVTFRPGAVQQANLKSAIAGSAPVYMYLFDWHSPVMDGKYKAVHCMEIAFCFDNIQRTKNMTGGTKEAQALADKMSSAWINFAKVGNPNHKGLPTWPAYNSSNTATMHFDNNCVVKPQMDKELFEVVK